MRNRLMAMAAGGVLAATLAGGAAVGVIHAQSSQQTPPPTPTQTPGQQQRQQRIDAIIDDFAGHLGVSADKVRDALKQTALDQINQAEQNGKITADQAQRARDAVNSGNLGGLGFFGRFGDHGRGAGMGMAAGRVAEGKIADFLGVTPQQLRQELNGQSLAQVAQAHGKTRDQLKQFILDTAKQQLQTAVQNNRLTQQQADDIFNRLSQNVDKMIDQVHQQRGRQASSTANSQ